MVLKSTQIDPTRREDRLSTSQLALFDLYRSVVLSVQWSFFTRSLLWIPKPFVLTDKKKRMYMHFADGGQSFVKSPFPWIIFKYIKELCIYVSMFCRYIITLCVCMFTHKLCSDQPWKLSRHSGEKKIHFTTDDVRSCTFIGRSLSEEG